MVDNDNKIGSDNIKLSEPIYISQNVVFYVSHQIRYLQASSSYYPHRMNMLFFQL